MRSLLWLMLTVLGALVILAMPWWALVMLLGIGALALWVSDDAAMKKHDEEIEPTKARRR